MKQRGRKPPSNINVVSIETARPAPPVSLNADQAAIWHQITTSLPAGFFSADIYPLLESYVRHIHTAAIIDVQIGEFLPEWLRTDDGLKRYNRLLALRERQSSVMLGLARSLRITNQSRYTPQRAATVAAKGGVTRKPWDF